MPMAIQWNASPDATIEVLWSRFPRLERDGSKFNSRALTGGLKRVARVAD
jgi:hypothetical protein